MSTDLIINDDEKFNRAVKMAGTLAKSKIVPVHFQGKAEDIFAVILAGSEMGMQPMQSLNAFVMIQGQTAMKAQAQLAVVRSKLPNAYIKIEVDEQKLIAKCTCARSKDDIENSYTATWDMSKATKMGLAGKQNYINQPLTMLRWRAITEALRAMFSDILLGFHAPEELEDLPPIREESSAGALLESLKEDQKRIHDEQRKPEDSQFGPLFLIENGKYRGKRLYEVDIFDLEEYGNDIRGRKTAKDWEKSLLGAIDDFISNQQLYREQVMELNEQVSA